MPPKNKENKQPKTQAKISHAQSAPAESAGGSAHERIVSKVVAKGITLKEANEGFDKLWETGFSLENERECVDQILLFIREKKGLSSTSSSKIAESPKSPNTAMEMSIESKNAALLQTLRKVSSLPNSTEVMDGITRWFKQASRDDQLVLTTSDILDAISLAFVRDRKQKVPESVLTSYFSTVYPISSESASILTQYFLTLKESVTDLSLTNDQCTSLVINALHACPSPALSAVQTKLASVRSAIQETEQQIVQCEVVDGKSMFKNRDLKFALTNQLLDAIQITNQMGSVSQSSSSSLTTILNTIPLPEGADSVRESLQSLTGDVTAARAEYDKQTSVLSVQETELTSTISELQTTKAALEKQLNEVTSRLNSAQMSMDQLKQSIAGERAKYDNKLSELKEKRNSLSEMARAVSARDSLVSSINSVTTCLSGLSQGSESYGDVSSFKKRLCANVALYARKECECILFLTERKRVAEEQITQLNKDIANLLSLSLVHSAEEPQKQLARTNKLVVSDTAAVDALKNFAIEIERKVSELVKKDKSFISSFGEDIGMFYGCIRIIGVDVTLPKDVLKSIEKLIPSLTPQEISKSLPPATVTTQPPPPPPTTTTTHMDASPANKSKQSSSSSSTTTPSSKQTNKGVSESSVKLTWNKRAEPEKIVSLEEIQKEASEKRKV